MEGSEKRVAPYGTWRSPIEVELVARGGGRYAFSDLRAGPEGVYFIEARPQEGGRSALVLATWEGESRDLSPEGFNVRTRVHEYGGGAYVLLEGSALLSSFDDGRLYRVGPDRQPVPLTPEPEAPNALRYADGRASPGGLVVCVREWHADGVVVNELVALRADEPGEPRTIVSGNDFYAFPRPSPDGRRLAWTTWNHPQMPFDGTELWVADLAPDGTLANARLVAGGPEESIFQPEWSHGGALHFSSDRTGWWNLYRERDGEIEALAPMEAECGHPQWVFGLSVYAFCGDGRIACLCQDRGLSKLLLVGPEPGRVEPLELPYTAISPTLVADGPRLGFVASGPADPPAVRSLDLASGTLTALRSSLAELPDPAWISVPRPIEFPTADGRTGHAFYYPPRNPEFEAPPGERAPLRVNAHGGPTSQSPAGFEPAIQLWTSRGVGYLDVNYGGSTGYGRAYRERLRGRWGEVDVDDCVAAARHLADAGEVDGARMAISGGSAGGYTTLAALAFRDVFAAGISVFGVADCEALARHTHKFERRYLDGLIGPYPEAADVYRSRSPLHAADRISRPLLLLQGLDDRVVPPEQAEAMVAALERSGVPYAYVAFEGEGHGFRREENVRRALEAGLCFLGRVFGYEPADELEPLELANLP